MPFGEAKPGHSQRRSYLHVPKYLHRSLLRRTRVGAQGIYDEFTV